ncbi:MAG TPA: beta-eliminating lyase-related protein [Rubrobacteraceae bacterium]|nr:beta-eliminating lyase-related protein [Rubrobacteraceae bacterium]
MIDLRSDTVTCPTEEMRRAMLDAAVGDDVFGEDPTVNRLRVHLDGVRLFNAQAATGIPARNWREYADAVSVC